MFRLYICLGLVALSFELEQTRVDGKRVFLTRKTAVSFIRDRRATSGTLNEECREGCSYEEVSENLIPDVCAWMKQRLCSQLNCTSGLSCTTTNADCSYLHKYQVACRDKCPAGFFGQNCSSECNKTCTDCNKVNGLCDRGCHSGWKGDNCEEKCSANMYGTNCTWSCGNCRGKGKCHHVNGSCLEGCDPGYQGDKCLEVCDFGYYGLQCLQECSTFCKQSRNCHHETGFCDDGCKSGWQGNECFEVLTGNVCDTACQLRFYGMTVAFSVTFAICITYVMLTRKANNGCFKRNEGKTESHFNETFQNEAADHGFQEMGEFNSSPAIYYNAD